MRHYKQIENESILAIGTGYGGIGITPEEYAQIMAAIQNRPEAPQGYDYRLKTDLTWEQYALPDPEPETETDGEISDSEALAIILGGETA